MNRRKKFSSMALEKDRDTHLNFDTTAKALKERETFLTTGCSKFDFILRGGFARKGITQIYGEAGAGKTQLALQSCLTVQIPIEKGGCAAAAAYICTEATFPIKRLQELLQKSHIARKYGATGDLVYIEHISSMDDLELCIIQRLPCLMATRKIGLLVIDSIAAPYRAEYCDKELKSRARNLRSIGLQLHNFTHNYDMSVICINQISAVIGSDNSKGLCSKDRPALGITWANLITNSLHLYKGDGCNYACITESPYAPRNTVKFKIVSSGIVAVD